MRSVRIIAALFLAFIPLLWAQPAWASTVSGYVYENGSITLYAPEGTTFDGVVSAFYGDPNDATRGADVSQIVAAMAVGQSVVTIDANNGVFGDPVYGTYKIFTITLSYTDPVIIDPTPEPTPTPTVDPTVEPTPDPTPTVDPTPQPTVDPTPTPTPKPKPTFIGPPIPVPTDTPSPTPTIEPTVAPTPTEEPVVPSPEPSPTISPSEEPTPTPETTTEPTPIPTEDVVNPTPEPEPSSTPESPTTRQAAIERLAEEAKADDPELDPQLAAIPVLGTVASAVLDTFNQLGNVGADMTPETRKTAEKTVIAAVIVTQAAVSAVTTAAVSASAASASYRKKD